MSSNVKIAFFTVLFFLVIRDRVDSAICAPRDYGEGSVVCVCNATYCDTLDPLTLLEAGTVQVFESSKAGARFNKTILKFDSASENSISDWLYDEIRVVLNTSQEFQEIIGFGGAFTDAAGINFVSLPESMKNAIVHAYYSSNGSEYNIGRVPIASCDFSTRAYSYDESEGDLELKNFTLAPEDFQYKIPFLQYAKGVATQPLLLFGSAWAPPAWMKTNNRMDHSGVLKGEVGGEYYQAWAKYYVKFLQEYEQHNLTFWGLTAQNEPTTGFVPDYFFQTLGFTPYTQGVFVGQNLGPALEAAGYGVDKIKLMIMDDQRLLFPIWPRRVFANENATKYVSGIAFHWYMNSVVPPWFIDNAHKAFPDKFILATEACEGFLPWQRKVILGDWSRAESYAKDIMDDLLHWTAGWVDWNLALNLQGGPNWAKNLVDSPIIVNATSQEFYKQPMYYALAHFSKFVKQASKRISTDIQKGSGKLDIAAFKTSAGSKVLVVLNRKSTPYSLVVQEAGSNATIQNTVPPHSIQTYSWA